MQSASLNGLIVPSTSFSDTIKGTEISKLAFNYLQLVVNHFYFCILVAHLQLQIFAGFNPQIMHIRAYKVCRSKPHDLLHGHEVNWNYGLTTSNKNHVGERELRKEAWGTAYLPAMECLSLSWVIKVCIMVACLCVMMIRFGAWTVPPLPLLII